MLSWFPEVKCSVCVSPSLLSIMVKRSITWENSTYAKRSKPAVRSVYRKFQGKKPFVPKTFAAKVRKVVEKGEEHKEQQLYSLNTPLPPSSNGGWTASSIELSPGTVGFPIPQGAGQGQRIGNQIKTRKAWVKGVIHPLPYDATTNINPLPTEIRMVIFKDKFNRTGQPASVALDFFQTGSTSVGPQNDLADTILDFNRDRYQIYHDQVLKVGTASYAGSGALPTFQNFANNDFSYNVKFNVNITKFLPAVIQYNDGGTQPMSDSLWMIFLPVQAGGGAFGATQIATSMSWSAVFHYTDA